MWTWHWDLSSQVTVTCTCGHQDSVKSAPQGHPLRSRDSDHIAGPCAQQSNSLKCGAGHSVCPSKLSHGAHGPLRHSGCPGSGVLCAPGAGLTLRSVPWPCALAALAALLSETHTPALTPFTHVLANVLCQLDWAKGHPGSWRSMTWGVSGRVSPRSSSPRYVALPCLLRFD